MKYTLLDLVQTILSRTEGDEVNSIDDTVESQQISKIVRSCYYDIVNRSNLPSQSTLFQLEASGTASKPVLMTLPTTIQTVSWIQYDVQTLDDPTRKMVDIRHLPLEIFIRNMNMIDPTEDEVDTFTHTIGTNTITFTYRTDVAPDFYTSFDDNTFIFNSYNEEVDTTLQKNKTLGWGKKIIPWTMSDTFTPDMDDKEFQLLLHEATSQAFVETKQTQHPLADRNARRGWVSVQKQKTKIPLASDFDKLYHFGRK